MPKTKDGVFYSVTKEGAKYFLLIDTGIKGKNYIAEIPDIGQETIKKHLEEYRNAKQSN